MAPPVANRPPEVTHHAPTHPGADHHNAVLEAARARVDALEPKLAAVLEPILRRAGDEAARRFEQYATNHLTAAGPLTGVKPTSTMICVRPRPEEAAAIADPDGSPASDLHCTLAFLGEIEGSLNAIREALAPVAGQHGPLAGVVAGYGEFRPPDCGILLPDVPGLVELRCAVTEALVQAGIDYGRDHGFQPHITVDGDPEDGEIDMMLDRASGHPLHFDALLIVRGDAETFELPLVGPRSLTADGQPPSPDWTPPAADELVDTDALAQLLRGKTDPIRLALIQDVLGPSIAAAGLVLNFDVDNPLIDGLIAKTGQHIVGIAETTQANVMRAIGSSYKEGLSIPDTAKVITQVMHEAAGPRAIMIARTEMTSAVNGASLAAAQVIGQATGKTMTKTWLTAPGAQYPRHEDYDDLDGQTVKQDETFTVGDSELQYPGDPDGDAGEVINCRCEAPWNRVSARPLAAARRTYEGQLVRLTTAAGRKLSVTPNHPVLTRHGWVAAGLLEKGDEVVCRSRLDLSAGCPDVDDVPTQAEERFAALELSAARRERIRGRSVNLHGEIPVGEVEVVWADDPLPLENESAFGEKLRELAFSLAHREVSFDGDATAGLGIEESETIRSGDTASLDPRALQDALDGPALHGKTSGEGEFALAGAVRRDDLGGDSRVGVLERLPLRHRPRSSDASPTQVRPDGHGREAALVRDLLVAHAALIELDPVVDLARFDYAGHVYSFSTKTGAYISSGILSGNCAMTYSDGSEVEAE